MKLATPMLVIECVFFFSIAELQELANSYNSARRVFPSILLLLSLLFTNRQQ